MQYYMAPMEGLTGYVYRNAFRRHFGGIDKYFMPFLTNKKLSHRERNDILPEHNAGLWAVPQILTNRAEDFLCIAQELKEYGYESVNLNLGCPSGTVAAKHRGAGFLAFPAELDAFLEHIFEKCELKISVKTRIGKEDAREWETLLAIYEKYPLEELIIHPRLQRDYYKNTPNLDAYAYAAEHSGHSLCYNGDITGAESYRKLRERFPQTGKVMLGRGLLANPWLPGDLRAWECGLSKDRNEAHRECDKVRLRAFCDDILSGYCAVMSGDRNVLFKMKELWVYMGELFEEPQKYLKRIRKAERISEYKAAVNALFVERELRGREQVSCGFFEDVLS